MRSCDCHDGHEWCQRSTTRTRANAGPCGIREDYLKRTRWRPNHEYYTTSYLSASIYPHIPFMRVRGLDRQRNTTVIINPHTRTEPLVCLPVQPCQHISPMFHQALAVYAGSYDIMTLTGQKTSGHRFTYSSHAGTASWPGESDVKPPTPRVPQLAGRLRQNMKGTGDRYTARKYHPFVSPPGTLFDYPTLACSRPLRMQGKKRQDSEKGERWMTEAPSCARHELPQKGLVLFLHETSFDSHARVREVFPDIVLDHLRPHLFMNGHQKAGIHHDMVSGSESGEVEQQHTWDLVPSK